MKIVITSGGFDPIHKGHIEYLRKAKELGNIHVCILNNDNFLINKKGKPFMDMNNRYSVLSSIKYVDMVYLSVDKDFTVCESIKNIYDCYKNIKDVEFIFAKGGDRFIDEIPETKICNELGIKIVDGLGEKIESSSRLINNLIVK